MKEKICFQSCNYVDEVNPKVRAVKCGKDGQWRGEGGVCPHKLDDSVNHPKHYTSGTVECIDAIESAVDGLTGMEALLTGQVIKYVWRWKWKNGKEDLRKAEWYLKRLMLKLEDDERAKRVYDKAKYDKAKAYMCSRCEDDGK